MLGRWIIDDAGISYAYARNLATGHGLVAQPGLTPVEGFSNFLWVVTLTPFLVLRIFDPVWTPKILAGALVFATFVLLERAFSKDDVSAPARWLALIALAVSPPIVIWTVSGLENPLTLLLASAYAVTLAARPRAWEIKSAVLSALLAMTHPELVLLAATGALVCVFEIRERPRAFGTFAAVFGSVMAVFVGFRLRVFGLPLPHTYYAKRTSISAVDRLHALAADPAALFDRVVALGRAHGGIVGLVLLGGFVVGAIALAARREASRSVAVWSLLAANAIVTYLWMDDDWMGEFRFATVVILAVFVGAALVADAIARRVRLNPVVFPIGVAVALASITYDAVSRMRSFAANPTTPYADVSRRVAQQFDTYAGALGVSNPSVLAADIGATLFESHLRVYDLAGLMEPEVVRTLKQNTQYWLFDHPEFFEWVFERIKPTFITTDKFWTYVPAFEKDPRFHRDYAPINTFADEYVLRTFRVTMHSGDFVRRDVLRAGADLERMRQAYQPPARADMRAGDGVDDVIAVARALDNAGRPHDARALWKRAADLSLAAGSSSPFVDALTRLGDARPASPLGDVWDREMSEGVKQLYEERNPGAAAATFDAILQANPSHYGALFQRARALSQLGRPDARTAWQVVLWMATRIGDQQTIASAAAALAR